MIRVCAVLVALASVCTLARADTTVTFDFENQSAGPAAQGTVLLDLTTGLKITIRRHIDFPGPADAPFSFFDLTPFGVAAFGMSLSPFNDPASPIPFVIDIDTSGLLPIYAGMIVNRIDWTMGDFIPSDQDALFVATLAGGVLQSATIGITFNFSGNFGSATQFASRANAGIDQLILRGGGAAFPNSLYFGGFSFNLSQDFAGSDLPESSAGGDVIPNDLSDPGGAPVPVPEPATLALVGAAAVLLARRRFR
jgi:hypothetical protein